MRAISVVALSLAVASPAVSQEQQLEANRQYPAGTRVSSPWTGVSFVVPNGFVGQYDEESSAFVMMKADGSQDPLVGVYAFSEASLEAIGIEVERQLAEQGVRLTPRGSQQINGNTVSGWYIAASDQGTGFLYASTQTGESGNAIAVVAARFSRDESGLQQVVDEVVASTVYTAAGAAQWRQLVAGGVLTSSGDRADISSGGGGTATGATDWSSSLELCSNGQYAYQERSETYISIEGVSASSSSSDQHAGQWWLVSDIAGNAILVLAATDGREFHWSVVEQGNGVALDGTLYTLARSQRCF